MRYTTNLRNRYTTSLYPTKFLLHTVNICIYLYTLHMDDMHSIAWGYDHTTRDGQFFHSFRIVQTLLHYTGASTPQHSIPSDRKPLSQHPSHHRGVNGPSWVTWAEYDHCALGMARKPWFCIGCHQNHVSNLEWTAFAWFMSWFECLYSCVNSAWVRVGSKVT